MKRTVVILLVLLMGLLTACAVPPKTEANVTDPDAMNATAVRQTEADTKTDWAQGLTEQQEVETEIENAVSADTLDRLQQDAAELLEEYETAKLDGTEEEKLAFVDPLLAALHGFLGCAAAFFLKIFVLSGAFAKYLENKSVQILRKVLQKVVRLFIIRLY